jgi:glycosyltransferase involved in cell wall biosynthesis
MLTRNVFENVRPVLAKYAELPIDWAPALAHPQLADRLRSADIFVLPSLEEGLARTSIEALACGLPVIVTAHTGSNDMVESGVNGEVVPIRDAPATAAAILKWWERIRVGDGIPTEFDTDRVSYTRFEREFLRQLRELNLLPAA